MSGSADPNHQDPAEQRWLTKPELAGRLHVSPSTVQRKVASAEWPCHRVGHLLRFSPADVAVIEAGHAG